MSANIETKLFLVFAGIYIYWLSPVAHEVKTCVAYRWSAICDAGPVLGQHRIDVSYYLVSGQNNTIYSHVHVSRSSLSMAGLSLCPLDEPFINSYNAELFLYKPWRCFFHFEIIINVLVTSFWLIGIPMLWVYDHYKYFNAFNAGSSLYVKIQNLTSRDVRF